ncbi:hypothetical protein AALO_G00172360 [Alosa alosa]|uniref:C-type natriuretic peptide 1 n=2 Tax=Alosa alosa TaxID=278164 RepID=A0AAV6GBB9_9TELE|nr:hypothetical protein AALO_G00172360 [Alosa alosa]
MTVDPPSPRLLLVPVLPLQWAQPGYDGGVIKSSSERQVRAQVVKTARRCSCVGEEERDGRRFGGKTINSIMLYPALLCVMLLLLSPLKPTETRALQPPNPNNAMQFLEQVLDRYNDLLTLDDLENLTNDQPEEPMQVYSSGLKVAEYPKWIDLPPQSDNSWLRLMRAALANQKRVVPDRVRRGWNRGCFGLKLDRIGSMSGLGC